MTDARPAREPQQVVRTDAGLRDRVSENSAGEAAQNLNEPAPRRYEDVAPLEGRRVSLRPVTGEDYGFLYEIATTPENLVRWRYRGTTPSPEAFHQSLWQGVSSQFLMIRSENGEPLGLITAYQADFRTQTTYVAIIIAPPYEGQGWVVMDATTLFLTYLFETWPFRKVYYEMLEFNYARIASGEGRYFHVEGRLRDHDFHAGRFWDLYMLAVYRDEYRSLTEPHLHRVIAGRGIDSSTQHGIRNKY